MGLAVAVGPKTIGLIVRGKTDDKHKPGVMEQHADCILPDGEPIGFFGDGGDASSGSSGGSSGSTVNSWANGPSLSLNNSGINMKGKVADYAELKKIRPMYVDVTMAKRYRVKSTVLLLDVSAPQAEVFRKYWKGLQISPGAFNLLGGNCSTHASEAFVAAGIVPSGIPGLDTPDNLYRQLKTVHSGKVTIYSGFIGAKVMSGGKYELVVEQ
jgi:hypothetical protein